MKKFIAVTLACATSILMPISSIFAASNNSLSKQISASSGKSLFMEEGWSNAVSNMKANDNHTNEIEYVLDGSTLFIKPTNGDIKAGDVIKFSLENAQWFFRHNTSDGSNASMSFAESANQAKALMRFVEKHGVIASTNNALTVAPFENKIILSGNHGINNTWFEQLATLYLDTTALQQINATSGNISISDAAIQTASGNPLLTVADLFGGTHAMTIPLSTKDFTNQTILQRLVTDGGSNPNFTTGGNEVSTYDISKGIYFPNTQTYVKYNNFVVSGLPTTPDVAYTLTVSSAENNVATIRFYNDYPVSAFATNDKGIPFPLVSLSKDEGDVRIQVGAGSNLTSITSQNMQYAVTASNNTTTSVSEKIISKYTFQLKGLQIKEKVPYSLQRGKITLTAPYGYYFSDPKELAQIDNAKTSLPILKASEDLFFRGNETQSENETLTVGGYKVGRYIDYAYETNAAGFSDFSKPIRDKIVINTDETPFQGLPTGATGLGLLHSSQTNGLLGIDGLTLIAQDYAPYDQDIIVTIEGKGVTKENFIIGTRKDWGVDLKTISAIPTLVSGRLSTNAGSNEFDADHKTARVAFSENIVASWWSLRETSFKLSDGAKFIRVKIEKEKNFNHLGSASILEGTYFPKDERTNYVKIHSDALTITDLNVTRDAAASFEMDMWISVAAGQNGDVTLSLAGDNFENQINPVVIAKTVSPITIESNVTDVKIGYQWQKVADFTITETAADRLKRNTTVELFIDDEITGGDNIALAPDFITEINSASNILISKPTIAGGVLKFTIERNSHNTPATIKFSNVYVKIDRTVPESNKRPYKIVAGGTAIAANYSAKPGNYDPTFFVKGIGTDFINVVTSANDKDSILSNLVRVEIGSNQVVLGKGNGSSGSSIIEMDTAAYISPESHSTMIPVRFVSQALGIPESQIVWDSGNRTVTIYNGSRAIQFKIGSSDININGVITTMYNTAMTPVKVNAEIRDDRSFLPFRALGNALSVPVDWDETTKTAIFNSDLSDNEKNESENNAVANATSAD